MTKFSFADPAVIYISWAQESEHVSWFERFRLKLEVSAQSISANLKATGEAADSGELNEVDWKRVTDFVAVVTDKYLLRNQRVEKIAEAELAAFVNLVEADMTDEHSRRAYLAPLEACRFSRHTINKVRLDDARLIRLKADGQTFRVEPAQTRDAEIFEAVNTIMNRWEERADAGNDQ